MLKVEQLRWFSRDFKLLDDQSLVAIGHYGWWRETGSLTIGESSYKVHREGFVSPSFYP